MKIELHNDDCFNIFKTIESGSVDLVLCDPPYGTIKGLGAGVDAYSKLNEAYWDSAIPPKDIFNECNRILRPNGCLVLFSQEPYTSYMITSTIPNLPFSYRLMWLKDHFANALLARKAPVSYFEDICVFFKKCEKEDFNGSHPLREYVRRILNFTGLSKKEVEKRLGHPRADHFLRTESSQFRICSRDTYEQIVSIFSLERMPGFLCFDEISSINREFKSSLLKDMSDTHPRVFNLPDGAKYKPNVLEYKKDYTGHHPTQKPVALMADLVRTYSNKGDTILDFTMGSGSTGVACVNEDRNFIGIEQDFKYFRIARQRIKEAQK